MTLSLAAEPALGYLLASLRILTWLFLVPPFNGRTVPAPAKIVLSVGLSLGIAPSVIDAGVPTGSVELLLVALTQVVVGALLGFVAQLLLGVIAAAGSLVDVFGGFALAAAYDPLTSSVNTIFGKFHQMLATMLLFATGGHLLVIGGLLKTFEVLPLGETPTFEGSPTLLITAFSVFFMTAVQIALPMIAVLFVADVGLALLTKVAPQMNALNVMLPAKIGMVLLLIGLSFPMLPEVTARLVDLVNESAAAIAGQAGSGGGSATGGG
jgi:flagellar biosynthesis protein FliR